LRWLAAGTKLVGMPFAVVSGANRGLGLETCRQLLQAGYDVLLTARDAAQAEAAAKSLAAPGRVSSDSLDIASPDSVARLVRSLGAAPRIDALVNNAAVSHKGFDENVARTTLDINYRGAVRVTDALLPLCSPNANIVVVSSGMGELSNLGGALRERLLSPALDRAGIEAIAEEFVSSVAAGRHRALGFPANAYSVSKALLNAFTRVLAKELRGTARQVNAVCPGWVRTRLGGEGAPRDVEQGAKGIVWAATLAPNSKSGGFFRDQTAIGW
jgi:carbonyl reductase 1